MAHDFWNTNMNPITMFNGLKSQNNVLGKQNYKKQNYLKDENLDGLISSRKLMVELGVGAKRIKAYYALFDEVPKFNKRQTYYKESLIPKIKELIKKEVKVIDLDKYISNGDLREMFGLSAYQAWYISNKEKLVKKHFSGNINYYEREKAINAFSKYKK